MSERWSAASPRTCSGAMYPRRPEEDAGARGELQGLGGRAGRDVAGPFRDEAEVEDLHVPVGEDHHVLGLHVPVHEAAGVGGLEAPRDLPGDIHGFAKPSRSASDDLAQRPAVQQLHDGVGHAVVAPDVVDGEDVRMRQRRHGVRLALEAGAAGGVAGDIRGEHLDRHLAPQPGVARAVHLAHAARTERPDDLVHSEPATGGERHSARVQARRPSAPPPGSPAAAGAGASQARRGGSGRVSRSTRSRSAAAGCDGLVARPSRPTSSR